MNIQISNLPPDTTEEELLELFSRYGKVKSVKFVRYPDNLSSKTFDDIPALLKVEEKENGKKIKNK
jgi:RNA recognition motif-containing protein